jgi:Protein of unknown function (DUF4019)
MRRLPALFSVTCPLHAAGLLSCLSAIGCQPAPPQAPDAALSASSAQAAPAVEAALPSAAAPPAAEAAPHAAAEQAARASTDAWLALIDQKRYADSWDAAAPIFQSAVSKEKWAEAAKAARSPLGDVVSRKFRAAEYKTSLPGAPDGEYVIVYYDTSFAQKATATESVTPAKATDGSWKVAGYFIH